MRFLSLQKALWSAMLLSMPFAGAYARHLSPDEALSRFQSAELQKRIAGEESMTLSYSEPFEGEDLVYVFNKGPKGFVVLSADDRMPALLGYSNNGAFDPNNIAPAMKWWLSQYAEEAASSFSIGQFEPADSKQSTRAEEEDWEKIPFLMSTQWDQINPYNLDCPIVNGKKSVTGCVATAMAQIIKYHGYPDYGNSSHTYQLKDSVYAATQDSLTFNFAETRFNYEEMLDKYTPSATEDQINAVANLMYACGVSVDMEYTPKESSSSINLVSYALRHYFKYDDNMRMLLREFFSPSEWSSLIYSELKEKRPVLMSGRAIDGGHQFVCDGYDGNGYFHMNWGWSGIDDGYYLLTALNPPTQGTGGYAGGYNSNVAIVCGIQPAIEDSPVWYPIYADGGIKNPQPSKSQVTIGFDKDCGIHNYSQQGVKVTICIKAVAEDGTEYVAESGKDYNFPGISDGSIAGYLSIGPLDLPKNLPAGEYKCYLVFKTPEGNYQEIMFPYTSVQYFNLSIDQNGNVVGSEGDPNAKADIKVVKFEPLGELIEGTSVKFALRIENYGEIDFNGAVDYKVYPAGSNRPILWVSVSLPPISQDDPLEGSITMALDFGSGAFDIIFYDPAGEQISEVFQISVNEAAVDDILQETSEIDVYSPSGIVIKHNASKDYVNALPKGLYILRSGSKTVKVLR